MTAPLIRWSTPDKVTEEAWIAEGRCKTDDLSGIVATFELRNKTDIFFPGRGENDLVKVAKQICGACPVQADCLDYAMRTRQTEGVYGGCSERERRRMRSDRSRAASRIVHGTDAGYAAHRRSGIAMCEPCRLAHNQAVAGWKAAAS